MKFDIKEIVAVLIVFLLPLGLGQFVAKSTLPEYGVASQLLGGAGAMPAHVAVASALEGAYASLTGMPAASTTTIVGFLLAFPPLLLALASVLLYLACRQMAYGKTQSVFAVVLFALCSAVSVQFMPGAYGSAQLALLLFAAFLVPFAAFVNKPGRMEMLGAAIVLGAAAGYANAAFALAGVAMAAAFAFAHNKKKAEKNYLMELFAIALVFAASGFLSSDKSMLAFSAGNLSYAASGMPFLLAGASACIGLFFFGKRDSEYLALLLLGGALAGFSPFAAAALMVFPVAEGATKMMGETAKGAKLAAVFACAFFMVFGIVYGGSNIYPALGAGLMLGVLAPLVLHFYEYNARAVFSVMGAGLVLFSLFFALFIQLPPVKNGYLSYTDSGLAEALSYLASSGAGRVAALEETDALAFYAPGVAREPSANAEKFLLSGNASMASGTYLLLSLPSLEALSQKGGFEVYYYAQNYTNSNVTYALFISQQGRLIAREIAAGGKFALKDGAALDSYGSYYAPVSLPRMVMLSGSRPISDKNNRMLVLEEGMAPPRLVGIYSGSDGGVELEKEFAGVAVYRVK
ncbi:MAG: hypothetical protein WCY41_06095 [Candidatus Micrarchaeia archaeon]